MEFLKKELIMNKSFKILGIFAVSLLTLSSAQAKNAWQECGVGAMVFPNNGAAAAISNITWDLGTTAVTSASVSEESCEGNSTAIRVQFIKEAYPQIEEDLIKGEGEHLTAFSNLLNCSDSQVNSIRSKLASDLMSDVELSQNSKAESLFNSAVANCSAS